MRSSIRVWFLGVLEFCAVFLLCLQHQWGLVAPRPVAAAPAASAGPAQVSVVRTADAVLLSGLVRSGARAPVLAEVQRAAGESTRILDRLIETREVGPLPGRLGPLLATFFPSGRELQVGAGEVQLLAEVPDAAAKEALERRVDASSAGMRVMKQVRIAASPERLQEELDALLTGAVIEFQVGNAALRPQSLPVLGAIASTLRRHPEARVRIEGHTDASGRPAENQGLSERRAESVKAALAARGVEPTRIETVGYGSARPLLPEHAPEDRARNRRIHLTVSR